ncbi:DUF3488 and transglutaminase-like domain-containing protein [Actinoplanes auranticolor]|uniref:Transglutaminase-like domain-containing protein n=1 Tax=Actinoplanes auranticolor TaxID=47988 RepID=A0A919S7J5_9ACTN|nr:transglutaminaseTgpA domain-containing protein [Actinoplanes auranticolor]GIM66077.1 hypothetical protein Aau02nite_21570 [Actinoplanes auranticolor]
MRTTSVVLAAAVGGMLFAPVFGVPALLLAVLVPALAVLLVARLCDRGAALRDWRPLCTAAAGLLTAAQILWWPAGILTPRLLPSLRTGVTESWRLALQSTWPARPDPELLVFVPLLVVAAAVLGVELVHRLRAPLPALLPSLALVVFTQLYAALPPLPATVAALAYAVPAGTLLVAARPAGARVSWTWVPATAALAAVVLAGLALPDTPPRYTLRQDQVVPLDDTALTNPLDEIAVRLRDPDAEVFRVGGDTLPDRWPLVVLDAFDGVNWTPAATFRWLGSGLEPGPGVTVRVEERTAEITTAGTGGPWLPSQSWPASVRGADPVVVPEHGTLLRPGPPGPARYTLRWWEPRVDVAALAGAEVDPDAPGGLNGIGEAPAGVAVLAREATRGLRPSFRTALVLEDFLRTRYDLAVGTDLPTGHGWPQLTKFLLENRRGTSEQFATSYVALARIVGIPARVAVGFRAPAGATTIRNGDVLAWPEVAVRGVGWVPLNPGGRPSTTPSATGGLAAAAEQARAGLPAPDDVRNPPLGRPGPGAPASGRDGWPGLLLLPMVPLLLWPIAAPAAWGLRARRRRRRAGRESVVGAWAEVRDRLRAHGVPVSSAMTARDLAAAAEPVTDTATGDELRRLAATMDRSLWSGRSPDHEQVEQTWAGVRSVRRALARRGPRARVRATLSLRGLLPPR